MRPRRNSRITLRLSKSRETDRTASREIGNSSEVAGTSIMIIGCRTAIVAGGLRRFGTGGLAPLHYCIDRLWLIISL